ncbi:hypothetical protein BHECKSOX_1411 [Bathymodiolus heckerae thiotrophic gill symbiont]|uniref:hypothetical protein n=1 Tax=Bathymodiolus heckerae thiotrophic gill symbiont TaxID=1052212 RepID=UPI0010B0B1AA|nr:hypothetical protein [Bathymodiolus heckerae thiotrophic gill symbiont]CAC9526804.1 hypothetical protein [uncultured Gammaproteobacteria bacterium]CAC9602581.1 hypothetical protein [uncultured Gammaproteobacteria bacterium]CAC9964236.1 hypothetical protein [uncultured Gammaproteobacteria bacterium]SHN91145.1 hypothetical protein BHECKSOX_1411 [Bathymodiolus heckerae thiotrophic gill symbiont]
MKLTTITQFGARLSLAKLHIKALLKASKENNEKINHIIYLVDPGNLLLLEYLKGVSNKHDNITLLTRDDNTFTNFKRLKKRAPYGGDCNYDFLIRQPEVNDIFLTLHDDSIITTENLYKDIISAMKNSDFSGYIDTRREIDGYHDILIDNERMSDIRLGTWFTCGNTDTYLENNYHIGDYRNYWKYYLMAKYGFSQRLKFHRQKVWLNGGFDLNIRARLNGKRFNIISDKKIAYHLTKITGFFASEKRNLLGYADSKEEVSKWKDYVSSLIGDTEQLEHDYKFMMNLASVFESEEIFDPLLNKKTLKEIFNP